MVATYGSVARAAGHPGTARQVAWALRGASLRGLPWQRVVGSGGRILLPGGSGSEQRLLLELEGVSFRGDRIRMDLVEFRFPERSGSAAGRRKPSGAKNRNRKVKRS